MISCLLAWVLSGPFNSPVPAELAAAHCWLESRGTVEAVSRVGSSSFCGQHQSKATSAADCIALRDPLRAAKRFRQEMRAWLDYTHGDLARAWRGMGCGTRGARVGGVCRNYERRIARLARSFRLAWAHRTVDKLLRGAS